MSVDHYENFPVASWLLPKHLRRAVLDIYRFARTADDIADEGCAAPAERLAQLAQYGSALAQIERAMQSGAPGGSVPAPQGVFAPLQRTIVGHRLPLAPFYRLLDAFGQDVTVNRYADFDALLAYCRLSANPVGALMLHLYGCASPANLRASDAICTGLQLTNFWQDVALDLAKGRIYIPQDDLRRFAVAEQALPQAVGTPQWRALMQFQVARTRALLQAGAPLALRLAGRIGWELRLVVCGGLRILERIEQARYDVFHARPTLGQRDWLAIAGRAITYRQATRAVPATS